MINTERKEVIRKNFEHVPVSGECDVCGKELLPVEKDKLPLNFKDRNDIYDYYRITTHHYDWGNDSCDSYEYTDCCCLNCALLFIKRYWEGCAKKKPFITNELKMNHESRLVKERRF